MRWYCRNDKCGKVVCEKSFHCTDLGSQIKEAVNAFQADESARTCKACGTVNQSKPAEGEIKDPNV